jgi:crotonobetainyl-CoA:carnitine CoA-transferase CaiB-like acyl-CoA transferase
MARIGMLSRVRVIDLSQAVAGPSGSQLLGDLGAEVIKIEPPEIGDIARGAAPKVEGESFYQLALNRNKRSVTLDLDTKTGKEAFHNLIEVSDVVFDNFRPGVLERLGADYETLSRINLKIVSCSITGYGVTGPYRDYPSFDDMAEGLSGVYSLCGEPSSSPARVPIPIADLAAGFFAATGIVAALFEREHTGVGTRVEVNMLDAIMYLMATNFQPYFITGKVPRREGAKHPVAPMVGIFQTRNDYLVLGPSWPRIARIIGKEWMIEDPRFATVEKRFENKRELENLIEDGLREADTEAWLELMHLEDIAAGPVNTLDKAASDPQVVHNRTIVTLQHPICGEIRGIECPIRVRGAAEQDHLPPPTLGQHTKEILKELLGYSDEKIKALKQEEESMGRLEPRGRRRL